MKNLLMLLVAVLGTSVMVSAFPAKGKEAPVKEIKATRHPKTKAEKKAKSEKKMAGKSETAKPESAKASK